MAAGDLLVAAGDLVALAGDLVAGDLDGGDFVGDFAGTFSAMSRTGAAACRFTGVRGVDFDDDAGLVAVTDALVLDFGDAPFAVEFYFGVEISNVWLLTLEI